MVLALWIGPRKPTPAPLRLIGIPLVEGGVPDVDGGGVRCVPHVSVVSLCRRFFGRDLRLLGFSILALGVRPLERAHKAKTAVSSHSSAPPMVVRTRAPDRFVLAGLLVGS